MYMSNLARPVDRNQRVRSPICLTVGPYYSQAMAVAARPHRVLRALAVASLALMTAACSSATVEDDPARAGTATPARVLSSVVSNPDAGPTTTPAAPTARPTTSPEAPIPEPACVVGPVPAEAGLDAFYEQGCSIDGFWVVAAGVVSPQAVVRAGAFVAAVFAHDPDLAARIVETGIRLGVIGADQHTTDMPEYRDLPEVFPEVDWNERARGLGATVERPLVSAAEENLLCLAEDRYAGEDILLHEFSHVMHEFGYAPADPGFEILLAAAYGAALVNPAWDSTYARTDQAEYWAEAVQVYFGRNHSAEPADGVHGPLADRASLAEADPAIFTLIDGRLAGLVLPPRCS